MFVASRVLGGSAQAALSRELRGVNAVISGRPQGSGVKKRIKKDVRARPCAYTDARDGCGWAQGRRAGLAAAGASRRGRGAADLERVGGEQGGGGGAGRAAEERGERHVTRADDAAQAAVFAGVGAAFPGHAVLGEESGEPAWLGGGTTRVVEGVDGTSNFVHGLRAWAVSIGVVRGGCVSVGVVYAPEMGETLASVRGRGATLNERAIGCRGDARTGARAGGVGVELRAGRGRGGHARGQPGGVAARHQGRAPGWQRRAGHVLLGHGKGGREVGASKNLPCSV